MMPSDEGTSRAPARPWSARVAISTSIVGAIAHSTHVSPKPASPMAKILLRPIRSPSDPPTSSSEPSISG